MMGSGKELALPVFPPASSSRSIRTTCPLPHTSDTGASLWMVFTNARQDKWIL